MYATYNSSDVTCMAPSPLPPLPPSVYPLTISTGDGAYSWLWVLVEMNAAIIVACMPSMLLFIKWVRGDMTEPKSTGAGSGRTRGLNATIGSGGAAGGNSARKHSHSKAQSDMHTHRLGSEEYIMQEIGGMVKSTEMMVVEMGMPPGSRGGDGGSMC